MARMRLPMDKTREILRLKWLHGRSHREIGRSLGVSLGVVSKVATRARRLGLSWEAVERLTDVELDVRLHGPRKSSREDRPLPDFERVHVELRRTGVTLELLHLEYLEDHKDGYRYSAFCDHYREWLRRRGLVMRQVHKAGDKCFLDYSGKKPRIVDPATGGEVEVELFVAVLGASNYTYVEATRTQRLPEFLASNARALDFFGGVPRALVPDQLKSAVTLPCRYEPLIHRAYQDLGRHYQTTVFPARPGKPRDKAKVEVGVQIAQRWILARLRDETFFSIEELNARIRELGAELNERPMRGFGGLSRRALFEEMERKELGPLPSEPFVPHEWARAKVGLDYHVKVDGHAYSVPYALAEERVELRYSASTIEVFHKDRRVASHARSYVKGGHTTQDDHRPRAHRAHADVHPTAILAWAEGVGVMTLTLVQRILEQRRHPEHGWRSCRGLESLGAEYGPERLEAACARALLAGALSYRPVAAILKRGLDRAPLHNEGASSEGAPSDHENVRGPDYYAH
jgi:transposase